MKRLGRPKLLNARLPKMPGRPRPQQKAAGRPGRPELQPKQMLQMIVKTQSQEEEGRRLQCFIPREEAVEEPDLSDLETMWFLM